MNILIPHSWLLDHLETDATPQEIQRTLSLCGPSVERINSHGSESVYDIEITTNRVDMMSVRGVAQEAAVILPRFGHQAQLKAPVSFSLAQTDTVPLPKISDPDRLCRLILATVIAIEPRSPSPDWLRERLEQSEIASLETAIDITNYVTHEYGHPCHAFDYDKIMALGGEIQVKKAPAGLSFTTLDNQTYQTVGGEVVFTNQHGEIIDLPAIKGTLNTAVDSTTRRILLWIESLSPELVRFTSMTHAIRTTAAQLNERELDPSLADAVFARALELYAQELSAKQLSERLEHGEKQPEPEAIHLEQSEVMRYLGITLEHHEVSQILTALGCTVESKDNGWLVTPPRARTDLHISADLIEEVARIYGYHNLPSELMATALPTIKPSDTNFALESRAKHFLIDRGYQELYSYSMVGEDFVKRSEAPKEAHIALRNPLTADATHLRRTLIPSLESGYKKLQLHGVRGCFEMAMVYHPQPHDLPRETLTLGLVETDIRALRTTLDSLLSLLYISEYKVQELLSKIENSDPINPFSYSATISSREGTLLILLGSLSSGYVGTEIYWDNLLQHSRKNPIYHPVSQFQPYKEDMTFQLPERQPVGEILEGIAGISSELIAVQLIDQYQQNFTFRLEYASSKKQLSKEDIKPVREAIAAVVAQHGGRLVGNV